MRLVAWNILHGGGARRTPHIVLRLCELAPDIAVLTEFRRTTGGQIAGVLYDQGLIHQASTNPEPGRNGVFVASRTPFEVAEQAPAPWCRNRWLDIVLPRLDATLTAVHAPDAHRSDPERLQRQAAFWQHLVRLARRRQDGRHLIVGDLNTGRRRLDEAGASLTGAEFLGRVSTLGYHDAYRLREPTGRGGTWHSHTGSAFRIDAVWVSKSLKSCVSSVRHGDDARTEKESDHAPVLVEMRLDPVENLHGP